MDNNNVTQTIISTINNIFEQLFSSIDNNLYSTFDKITFINSDILKDNYFRNIFGTSTTNGILLIANSLLIAIIIYFAIKYFLAHFTYSKIESPKQFIFKLIIFGICMNFSYFLLEKFLDLFYDISLSIQNIGESIFQKNISFSTLINTINSTIYIGGTSINIFSVNGLLKGTLTFTLLSLVFSSSPKLNFFIKIPVPTATAAAGVDNFKSQPSILSNAEVILLIICGSFAAIDIDDKLNKKIIKKYMVKLK